MRTLDTGILVLPATFFLVRVPPLERIGPSYFLMDPNVLYSVLTFPRRP